MNDWPPNSILLADVGGTNTRFALAGSNGGPEHIVCVVNDRFAALEEAIESYLAAAPSRPSYAVLAVAGPIHGDEIALTNRTWRFRLSQLARVFGFINAAALNDFEAIAWGVPALGPDKLRAIGPRTEPKHGAKVVCGPGTGLGVGALVPSGLGWTVIPSEGGHATMGPCCSEEEPVFARLRDATGHISAETILSGPGIARLHSAIHCCAPMPSEDIVERARNGDAQARATVDLFVRLLARFAGGLALTFKAMGGVYLTGGLGYGLGALLDEAAFRRAFEAHPPYEQLLASIPTFVISDEQPGLTGCAVYGRAMFGDLSRSAMTGAQASPSSANALM